MNSQANWSTIGWGKDLNGVIPKNSGSKELAIPQQRHRNWEHYGMLAFIGYKHAKHNV
jgi:hypothetical protein